MAHTLLMPVLLCLLVEQDIDACSFMLAGGTGLLMPVLL
jgi:hypothetical protein